MIWSVTIPGQPVSWNAAYRTGRRPRMKAGRPVLNEDMTPAMINRPVLTPEAEVWRNDVQRLAQNAKPSHWRPKGQLRITIDLRLTHPMDAENVGKLVLDGLARGIDYDDRHFLPCYRSMGSGYPLKDACVILTIEEA